MDSGLLKSYQRTAAGISRGRTVFPPWARCCGKRPGRRCRAQRSGNISKHFVVLCTL